MERDERAARRDRRRPRAVPRRRARRARRAASRCVGDAGTVEEAVRAIVDARARRRAARRPHARRRRGRGDPPRAPRSGPAAALPRAVGLRRARGRDRGHPRRRARLRDQDDLRRRAGRRGRAASPTATPSSRRGSPASCSTRSPGDARRRAEVDPELDQLTAREREVLRHIARGYLYKEIALRLGISAKTVEAHVSRRAAQAPALQPPRAQPLGGRAPPRRLMATLESIAHTSAPTCRAASSRARRARTSCPARAPRRPGDDRRRGARRQRGRAGAPVRRARRPAARRAARRPPGSTARTSSSPTCSRPARPATATRSRARSRTRCRGSRRSSRSSQPRLLVPLGRHALAHFAPGEKISEVHGRT